MEPIHGQERYTDWHFKQATHCAFVADPECYPDGATIFLRLTMHSVTKHILLCGYINTHFNLGLTSCAFSNRVSGRSNG